MRFDYCMEENCPDYELCRQSVLNGDFDYCTKIGSDYNMPDTHKYEDTVSIIIPCFNGSKYVYDALSSIEKQTYPSPLITTIFVDDGSSDDSLEQVKMFVKELEKKKNIMFNIITISNERNMGANYSRNEGLKHAKSGYVFFMDVDSVLSRKSIETFINKLEESGSDVGYAYSNFVRIWENEDGQSRVEVWSPPEFDADLLRKNNYISMMSMVKRDVIPDDGFDVNLDRFQDWDLWLTLLENGIVGVKVDDCLFSAYIREGGISQDKASYHNAREKVLKKHGLND